MQTRRRQHLSSQRIGKRPHRDEPVGGLEDAVVDVARSDRAVLAMNSLLLRERRFPEACLADLLQHRREHLVVPRLYPRELRCLHRQRRAHQRAVDPLALPCPFTVEERRGNRVRHLDPGREVGYCRVDVRRNFALHLPFARHQPGQCLHDDVVPAALRERSEPAERCVLAIDDPRIDGAQRLVVDLQLFRDTRPVVDHHNVRRPCEAMDHRLCFGPGHVHRHVPLAAVQAGEGARLLRHEFVEDAPRFAFNGFELDDVRAHVGEVLTTERSSDDLRELEYSHSGERAAGHAFPPVMSSLPGPAFYACCALRCRDRNTKACWENWPAQGSTTCPAAVWRRPLLAQGVLAVTPPASIRRSRSALRTRRSRCYKACRERAGHRRARSSARLGESRAGHKRGKPSRPSVLP